MRQPYNNLLINTKPYTFAVDVTDSIRTKDYNYNLLFTTLYNNIIKIKNDAYTQEIIGKDDRAQQILIYQIFRLIDLMLIYVDNPTIDLGCQIQNFKSKFNKYGFNINIINLFNSIGITYGPTTSSTSSYIQLEDISSNGYILLE